MEKVGKNVNGHNKQLILTILSALAMGFLIFLVFHINVPNPNMILITAMVFFTSVGGVLPGVVSALMMLLYSMYFFSTNHTLFQYTEVNFQKILVIIFGIVVNFIIVALLKRKRDKAERMLMDTNKYLLMSNEYLADKVDTAERITELTQSVSALLTNMPALTFTKDIATGKYLACNQNFAEYAHKESPDQVIGLTDLEIFDEETARHFMEDDRKAVSMDKPYIFTEDTPDGKGVMHHFQTTKQKFTDTTGRQCLLGMCMDISELVDTRQESAKVQEALEEALSESVTFGHIAQALSADYSYLYYVDMETNEFTEYRPDPKHGKMHVIRHDSDFFEASHRDAQQIIYEKDLEEFLKAFNKETIIQKLSDRTHYTLNYRQLIDGVPVWCNMKITRMGDDSRHLVVGVRNIDKQMKEQEEAERLQEERITYARIHALTRNYIAIYSVDPDTERYEEYSSSSQYDELGIKKTGDNFFAESRKNAAFSIYQEDLPKFYALFSKKNILREIETNGVFSLDYRLMIDGNPVFVNLNAGLVEEKDGRQLIIGVNNIDSQVRQNMEYERSLAAAQIQAHRDELTGVKNKLAYTELEEELNQQIREKKDVHFAITVFDVNELKQTNDNYGHQAGDELLRDACAMICHAFAHSPVFRIGGDEFAAISRGYDYDHIDEIVKGLKEENRVARENHTANIALGMARFSGESTVAEVFEKADHNMYLNKKELKVGR